MPRRTILVDKKISHECCLIQSPRKGRQGLCLASLRQYGIGVSIEDHPNREPPGSNRTGRSWAISGGAGPISNFTKLEPVIFDPVPSSKVGIGLIGPDQLYIHFNFLKINTVSLNRKKKNFIFFSSLKPRIFS